MDVKSTQKRLGVSNDGVLGPLTYAALFVRMGCGAPRAIVLGKGAAAHFADYGLLDGQGLRLAHWLAQAAHETGGFLYMQELGGPSYFAKYDGRKDLGNTQPGDGARYHGRGLFQLTGRANYKSYGEAMGLDLVNEPDLAAQPDIGLWIACEFWRRKGLNALADADDVVGVTRKINGGTVGLADRKARLSLAKSLIL